MVKFCLHCGEVLSDDWKNFGGGRVSDAMKRIYVNNTLVTTSEVDVYEVCD